MAGGWTCFIVALLLHVFMVCWTAGVHIPDRYLKREERGTQSRLRFTSGSYGFYNASIKESHTTSWSTMKSDQKMGIYVYDSHTRISYEIDNSNIFVVKAEQIEDFVFLRVKPKAVSLNSDVQSVYVIKVTARNNRTKELIDVTNIYLNVIDTNEFEPAFKTRNISISIDENIPVGTTVLQVKAYDADLGQNGNVYYFIPPNEVLSVDHFSLHPHTGELSLLKPLDFDRKKMFNFHVIASDLCPSEKLRKTSEPLTVRINVRNMLNYPESGHLRGKRQERFERFKTGLLQFRKSIYKHSVAEISPPYTALVKVELEMGSAMLSTNVVFGFQEGNEDGCFEIGSKTGQIYTIKELDFEKTKSYNLTVIAYHRTGSLIKGKTTVILKVLDSNDHSPTFSKVQEEIEVPEETALGSVIYKAQATDSDTGLNSKILYSVGNINSTYFEIDDFSGDVRVVKRLDRDSQKSVPPLLYLMIKASDFGTPVRREGRMILKIKIKRVNDNPPTLPFRKCSIYVARNARNGLFVMKVNAIDLDKTSTAGLSYTITGNIFRIDINTGDVKLRSNRNVRKGNFIVQASDGKSLSRNLVLAVLPVSARQGRKINVSCSENLEYTRAKQVIQERQKWEKSLKIKKPDQVSMPQSRVHKPIFLEKPDTTIFLQEDLPIGSIVTKVLAVDKELKCYGLVLYSIISGNNNVDANFNIDMLNGTLYLNGKIDREQNQYYNLKIRAWDTDVPPHYTDINVRVEIVDVNDNGPVFTQRKYSVSVPESAQPGLIIAKVEAKDPDQGPNGEVVYSVISDLKGTFALDKYTGILSLKKRLDYEKQSHYDILIKALDSSSQNQKVSQTTVEIKVIDLNDSPPKCLPAHQTFEITRDFPAGAVIGRVNGYDPDTGNGGKIIFEIAKGKAQRLFSVDSEFGILRTNLHTMGQLVKDFVYNVSVKVSDLGTPQLSTYCHFLCILRPSFAFERPKFQIEQNPVIVDARENMKEKLSLSAVLEGSGQLEYSLVDGTGIGGFSVDPKTGVIDTEYLKVGSAPHYWLTLNAHLKDNPSVYSNIPILLYSKKKSVKTPYYDPSVYRVSVKENQPAQTVVEQLVAVDPNAETSMSDLVFGIVTGNDLGHFEITKKGILRTTVLLDRERYALYQLNVSVANKAQPKILSFASVTIRVEDTNDNGPVVSGDGVFRTINLLSQTAITSGNATFVTQVIAFDKDIGKNGELVFEISGGGGKFAIGSKSGIVTTKAELFEGELYVMIVTVRDNGTPQRSAKPFYFEFLVIPKPFHTGSSLAFKKAIFTFKMKESTERVLEPVFVASLLPLLTSVDFGEFVMFTIESGNEDTKFRISEAHSLELISELDHETKSLYTLFIKVNDGISSAFVTIRVIVEDVNDNPPMTSQSCYQAVAMENEAAGKFIAQVEGEFVFLHFHVYSTGLVDINVTRIL